MNGQKEWSLNEELPKAFVKWINAWMVEQWLEQKKGVIEIAAEIGVRPALLSRWMGGKGSLEQKEILLLVEYFGIVVYTLLGIPWPNDMEESI